MLEKDKFMEAMQIRHRQDLQLSVDTKDKEVAALQE